MSLQVLNRPLKKTLRMMSAGEELEFARINANVDDAAADNDV
jgi:hypothetical protein